MTAKVRQIPVISRAPTTFYLGAGMDAIHADAGNAWETGWNRRQKMRRDCGFRLPEASQGDWMSVKVLVSR